MPMILTLRFLNSPSSPAMVPSSVVQTGVKFFGWLNKTAQPSPIQSWKLIVPLRGLGGEVRRDIVDTKAHGVSLPL